MRRIARVCTATASSAALVLATGVAVAHADPAGTVTLSGAQSAYGEPDDLIGVTDGFVIYTDHNGLQAKPVAGGAVKTVDSLSSGAGSFTIAGDMVAWQQYSANGSTVQRWANVATGDTGTSATQWLAAAPLGGIYVTAANDGSIHAEYEHVADPTNPVDLGTLDLVHQYSINAHVGPDGVAFDENGQSPTEGILDYIAFNSPGAVTRLDLDGMSTSEKASFSCSTVTSTEIGCYTQSHIARISLSSNVAPLLLTATNPQSPQFTDTTTGWLEGGQYATVGSYPVALYTWHTEPRAGGTVTTLADPVYDAVADADAFYLSYAPPNVKGGIYSATSAGDVSTQPLVASATQPNAAFAIGLAPGRVAWRDDSKTTRPVWSRSLTSRGGNVVAGAQSLTADTASGYALSVSGMITAYEQYVSTSPTDRVAIAGAGAHTITIANASGPSVSGNHVLYDSESGSTNGHAMLRDLVRGTTTDLTKSLKAIGVTVWGNYVAYARADGSVWRKPLDRGAAVQLQAPLPRGTVAQYAELHEWGDWVAWQMYSQRGNTSSDVSLVRNAKTLARARSTGMYFPIAASASGVELEQMPGAYFLQPWSGGAVKRLPATGGVVLSRRPVIDGTTMAWIGTDQRVRAATISKAKNEPRSLGDGRAPLTVKLGATWTLALPTSAALTACTVRITQQNKTIRSLSCTRTPMGYGIAATTWRPSRKGTYSWSIVARNADGPLLSANGSGTSNSGTVRVV